MQCESCLKTIKNYFVYCRCCNNLEHKYTVFTCFCLNELKFKTCDVCRQYIEKDCRKGRFHKNQYCQEEFQIYRYCIQSKRETDLKDFVLVLLNRYVHTKLHRGEEAVFENNRYNEHIHLQGYRLENIYRTMDQNDEFSFIVEDSTFVVDNYFGYTVW